MRRTRASQALTFDFIRELREAKGSGGPSMSDKAGEQLLAQVDGLDISHDGQSDWWRLAEIIWKTSEAPGVVRRAGYGSVDELLEARYGFGRRTVQYLRALWSWFKVEHPLPLPLDQRLCSLPWTTARELVGLVTPENAVKWIIAAETNDRAALRKLIETEKGGAEVVIGGDWHDEERSCRRSFGLHDSDSATSQYKTVALALDDAKHIAKTDADGFALELICIEHLAVSDAAASPFPKKRLLERLERVLGVRLLAFSPRLDRMVYGAATADALNNYLEKVGAIPIDDEEEQ